MSGPSGERVTEWAGGSLSELMSVLSAAALPARIRVFAPGAGGAQAGEVHLLAGGVSDAFAGDQRGQEAVSALQHVAGARFVIDTCLPDPETGSLAKPGPGEGNLAQRPLVEVMRYCEEYVLTCTLEVWRGEDQARISYRRGELVGTVVGGSDAPERLPEVMGWKEGFFEIDLPLPVTPPVPAPSRRTGTAAVVGASAPVRPAAEERRRRETDPLISLAAIKKSEPMRPAGAPVRPTEESVPKLPRVPSLPGFMIRVPAPAGTLPTQAAGARPAPSGPAPSPVTAPIRAPAPSGPAPSPATTPIRAPAPSGPAPSPATAPIRAPAPSGPAPSPVTAPIRAPAPSGPAPSPVTAPIRAPAPSGLALSPVTAPIRAPASSPAPTADAAAPVHAAQAPVGVQALPAASHLSTAGIPAETGGTTVPPAPAPDAHEIAPTPPAVAASLPAARAPGAARLAQSPLPGAETPMARGPAPASPLAPVPWPAAKPSVAQPPARTISAPVTEAAAAPQSPSRASPATPPPSAAPLLPQPAAAPQRPSRALAATPPPTAPPQRPSRASQATPPPTAAPASLAASAPAAPVQRTPPATPPPAQAGLAAASQPSGAHSPPRPSEPAASPAPHGIRGASTAAARTAPSTFNRISGATGRPSTPPRGTEERPFGVEISEDMQDPAAFVNTPAPQSQVMMVPLTRATPTPVSELPRPDGPPTVRLTPLAPGQPEDLAVDIEEQRYRPGKRRAQRGPREWPLLVHVLLGIVLGAAIVVAYSAYYGLPLPLP